MLDKFSWLHLSDFHFRSGVDTFSQNVSTNEITRDIISRLSSNHPLQFVAVTGDIAFSGKPCEYEVATQFFDSIAGEIGLGLNRFFVVPGNHDVDRDIWPHLYAGVQQQLTNQQAVDEFLGREDERTALMERQSAFRRFQEHRFVDTTATKTADGLARVRILNLGGLRVCILELNSAWLSGSNDRDGNLIVGERQMINALALVEEHRPHLAIALAHHPVEWMSEFDRLSCSGRLLPRLDFFHSGHRHQHEVTVRRMPGAECHLVAAGSSHASRHYKNSYNLIELEIGTAECRVRRFEYEPSAGRFAEGPSTQCRITLGGPIDAQSRDVAQVLSEVEPTAQRYADYLAALLLDEMNEVPIMRNGETCIFASREYPLEFQFNEVQEFLRLRNLLRTYGDMPLKEALAIHRPVIVRLTKLLSKIAAGNAGFAEVLSDRVIQARSLTGRREADEPPYQVQYLDELASAGDWAELADTARRYRTSSDEDVRIAACRQLAWAFLRSEALANRNEGLILARKNLKEKWAEAKDYIVASTGAESLDDRDCAVRIALSALGRWPHDNALREYCRSLAMQSGGRALRLLLDESGVETN